MSENDKRPYLPVDLRKKSKKTTKNTLFAMPRGEKSSRRRREFSLLPKVSMEVRVKTLVKHERKSYLLFWRGVKKRFLPFPEKSTATKVSIAFFAVPGGEKHYLLFLVASTLVFVFRKSRQVSMEVSE